MTPIITTFFCSLWNNILRKIHNDVAAHLKKKTNKKKVSAYRIIAHTITY